MRIKLKIDVEIDKDDTFEEIVESVQEALNGFRDIGEADVMEATVIVAPSELEGQLTEL